MMTATSVTPLFQPDTGQMRQHLEHLFGGDLDGHHNGLIEIAWTSAQPINGRHPLVHARLFGTDEIEEAVEEAARQNAIPNQNVYVGAALRKPNSAGRCSDDDFLAMPAYYADLDEAQAARGALARYKACPPTLVVITGKHPDIRAQLWWRLEQPDTEPQRCRQQMHGLARAFGGDPSVLNPGRVMRLAGSVAWAVKEGRQTERTELTIPSISHQGLYLEGEVARHYAPTPLSDIQGSIDPDDYQVERTGELGLMTRISDGRERYMRNTVLACMIEFIGQNGAAPTVDELFAVVWPQYSQNVSFRRAGRGPDEVKEKCAHTLRRFEQGRIRGAADLDEAVRSYQAKTYKRVEPLAPQPASEPDDDGPITAASLVGVPPAREWIVPDWLPAHNVTSLYGDGGIGKTLVAQQLANSIATGQPWLGLTVAKGRVLAVFCEDDKDELWRRQRTIEERNGLVFRSELVDLLLWPRVGKDNMLMQFVPGAQFGPFYTMLHQRIVDTKPALVILDTAADLYGGNENDRMQVNQFIKRCLGSLIVETGCTILMLAHPSMSGLASGAGTGGSTAWNNTVRSRWFLQKPTGGDDNERVLTRKKANYAKAGDGERLDLIWEEGILTLPTSPDAIDRIEQRTLKVRILDIIEQEWIAKRPITGQRGQRRWDHVFPPLLKEQVGKIGTAMKALETEGAITTQHGNNKRRGYMVLERPNWEKNHAKQ